MNPPTGTVTFLFTDVVGSTSLWERFPDQTGVSLAAHEALLRGAIEEFGGHEFATAGDSFDIAFSSASAAVGCAVRIQRAVGSHSWPGVEIGVRIGVHTGTAEQREGRYYGQEVNRARDVCAAAGRSQVLVSDTAASLARDALPVGHSLLRLRPLELGPTGDAIDVWTVSGEGLSIEQPAASVGDQGNLPRPASQFIGRSDEIEAIGERVRPDAILTLLGLGGFGKTRVAIEVGRRNAPRFSDGVWWVDLTPLTDRATIAALVSSTLGIGGEATLGVEASLLDGLERLECLIVFDNCEHVADHAADLIAAIRQRCPGVGILATSRTALGIAGEQVWPLAPLDAATDGVELLLARASDLDMSRAGREWESDDLVLLCDRLDGIPLAIEMAAARLRSLSPREIIERLDERFRMLKNRDRQATKRHQTLLAALDWSYELLDSEEQLLLDRLSVFPSDFDLESVERLCSDDKLDEFDILDLLSSLIHKSLLSSVGHAGRSRYRLLETVRQYGRSHLSGIELERLQRSLVVHMHSRAVDLLPAYMGEDRGAHDAAAAAYVTDWDNYREAVRLAIDFEEPDAVEEIVEALWDVVFQTSRTEVVGWCRDAQSMIDPPMCAFTIVATSVVSAAEMIELTDRAIERGNPLVPNHGLALAYGVRHWIHATRGGPEAIENARKGLFHAPARGPVEVAWQHANLASFLASSDSETASEHAEIAAQFVRTSTNPQRLTIVPSVATYEARYGDARTAYELCDASVRLSEEADQRWTSNTIRAQRAAIALRYGVGNPAADLAEALSTARDQRAWYAVWLALGESLSWLGEHCETGLASMVSTYLRAHGIWFRGHRDAPIDDGDAATTMTRDALIDEVLVGLETTQPTTN